MNCWKMEIYISRKPVEILITTDEPNAIVCLNFKCSWHCAECSVYFYERTLFIIIDVGKDHSLCFFLSFLLLCFSIIFFHLDLELADFTENVQ